MITTNNERNAFADFLKGVATFLVIWGHVIQSLSTGDVDFFENPVFKTIYTFHMPLFMYISGYVFYWSCKKHSLITNLVNRAFAMGIPMLTWGLIYYFGENWKSLPDSLTEMMISLCKRSLAIWFLWAVFLASLFVATIYFFIKKEGLRNILMCLAGFLICVLPGNENLSLFVYPYFLLGFWANEKDIGEKKWYTKAVVLALLIWLLMLPYYEKKHYIYLSGVYMGNPAYGGWEQIKIDFFRFVIGLVGTIGIISVLQNVYQKINNTCFAKWIEVLGKHSLALYVMQTFFLSIVISNFLMRMIPEAWQLLCLENAFVMGFIIAFPLALISAAILLFISLMIEKNKVLRILLFGKRKIYLR